MGASERVLRFGTRLIAWQFLFDDQVGEGERSGDLRALMESLGSYHSLLATGYLPAQAPPLLRALKTLLAMGRRLAGSEGDPWMRRFCADLRSFFDGCVLEYEHRRRHRTPSLGEYRRLRSLSIGTRPDFTVIELIPGAALNDAEYTHPALQRLIDCASLLCAWTNDIHSWPKEQRDGEVLNLIAVLATEGSTRCTADAVSTYWWDLCAFEAQARVISRLSDNAARYAAGLSWWVHGNVRWHGHCQRYAGAGERTGRAAGASARPPPVAARAELPRHHLQLL